MDYGLWIMDYCSRLRGFIITGGIVYGLRFMVHGLGSRV